MNNTVTSSNTISSSKKIITVPVQFFAFQNPPNKGSIYNGDKDTAVAVKDGWIYLFKNSLDGKQYRFEHEIYIDKDGKYQQVDLVKNFGKDIRKPGTKSYDSVLVNSAETVAGDKDQIPRSLMYFLVFSRVQLPWSRLPVGMDKSLTFTMDKKIGDKYSTIAFLDWKDARGAEKAYFSEQFLERQGSFSKYYFWDPIDKASYYHNKFLESRDEYIIWVNEPNRYKKRFMHETITAISKKRDVYKYLDSGKFSSAGGYHSKEMIMISEYETWAAKQVKLMNSTQFKAIWADFKSAGNDAQDSAELILAKLIDRLHEAKPSRKYLYEIYFDKESFLNEGVFAVTRKSTQATYEILSVMSGIIIRAKGLNALVEIRALIEMRTGLKLDIIKWSPGQELKHMIVPSYFADISMFKRYELESLTGKIANSGAAKSLLAVIEIVNLALAVQALSNSKSSADRLKNIFGLAGSLTDFMGGVWMITQKLGRKNVAKIGILSGVFDAIVGTWDMTKEINTGDYDAAIGQGTVAVGGLVMAVGAYMIYLGSGSSLSGVGLAPGVIIILIGAVLEAIGTIIHFLSDNEPIEDWINHCLWGNDFASSSSKTEWSEGIFNSWKNADGTPDLDKQIRALNNILYSFTLDQKFVSDGRTGTYVTFIIKPSMIHDQSIVYLDLKGSGPLTTSQFNYGPMDRPKIVRSSDGRITEISGHYSSPGEITKLEGKIKMDIFGDGKLMNPGEGFKNFVLS